MLAIEAMQGDEEIRLLFSSLVTVKSNPSGLRSVFEDGFHIVLVVLVQELAEIFSVFVVGNIHAT